MKSKYEISFQETCVLSLLAQKDCYGYDIAEQLSKHIDISEGTVYSILRKLRAAELITTYLCADSSGPPRKYCSLTSLGRELYDRSRQEWVSFAHAVITLLGAADEVGDNHSGQY